MTIRAKLIFWFFIAALLPATVITLFAAGDAAQRFRDRAGEELQAAVVRTPARMEGIRDDIAGRLSRAAGSIRFGQFLEAWRSDPAGVADPFFAESLNRDLNLGLSYLDVLDAHGTVLSSLEWPAFAGKQDLQWPEIGGAAGGSTVIGPVRLADGERMAVRIVHRVSDVTLVGGWSFDKSLIEHFRTAARIGVLLWDGIEGSAIAADDGALASAATILTRTGFRPRRQAEPDIRTAGGMFQLQSVTLGGGDTPAAVIYLYPLDELNEEIANLWRSFLLAAVAGTALALILGIVIARSVASPLRNLIQAFDLVALGDFGHRLTIARTDELGEIFASFNRMAADLEQSRADLQRSERVAAWQGIARKIAHEIKNPLSPIQISIETLRKVHERKHPDFDRIFHEAADTILEEVEKIRHIVQEFSDFARMPEPRFQPTDLREVIEKAVRLFRPKLAGVDLDLDLAELAPVQADPDQLHRLLVNLIANALDALAGAGRLRISLSAAVSGDNAVITVQDSGPGMSAEELRQVFTPYFTTKPGGTGLGLVIAQRIVEQHRGHIAISSSPGEGLRVEVSLPR